MKILSETLCPYPLYVEEGGRSMKPVITLSLALDNLFAGALPIAFDGRGSGSWEGNSAHPEQDESPPVGGERLIIIVHCECCRGIIYVTMGAGDEFRNFISLVEHEL